MSTNFRFGNKDIMLVIICLTESAPTVAVLVVVNPIDQTFSWFLFSTTSTFFSHSVLLLVLLLCYLPPVFPLDCLSYFCVTFVLLAPCVSSFSSTRDTVLLLVLMFPMFCLLLFLLHSFSLNHLWFFTLWTVKQHFKISLTHIPQETET